MSKQQHPPLKKKQHETNDTSTAKPTTQHVHTKSSHHSPSKPSYDKPSQIALMKKELSTIQIELDNQIKLNTKIQKKLTEQTDELKRLKQENTSLSSDNLILQKSLQKLTTDKNIIESQLTDNKKYISKLESKLLNNASNQFLNEINTKLKTENTSLKESISSLETQNTSLSNEIVHLQQQITILNKAIQIKLNNINLNNTSSSPSKPATQKQPFTKDHLLLLAQSQSQNETLLQTVSTLKNDQEQLSKQLETQNQKYQELSYAKAKLMEMYVEKETQLNNSTIENNSFQTKLNQIISERDMLRECIEKATIQQKTIENDIQLEAKEYQSKINKLQNENKKLNEENGELITKVTLLDKSMLLYKEKCNQFEKSFKEKVITVNELKMKVDLLNEKVIVLEKDNKGLQMEKDDVSEKLKEVKEEVVNVEKENNILIEKVKELSVDKENTQVALVKQNLMLTQSESKMKNEIEMLNKQIEEIRNEREKCKQIIKELTDRINTTNDEYLTTLTENASAKKCKVDGNILGTNVPTYQSNGSSMKGDMRDMIKKEKEKNYDLMSEIRKIKSAINK